MKLFKKEKKRINHIKLVVGQKAAIDYPTFMPIPRIGETVFFSSKYHDCCGFFKVTNVSYAINTELDYTAIEISSKETDKL